MSRSCLNLIVVLAIFLCSSLARATDVVVQTPSGQLRGKTNHPASVNEFKGIRYAYSERFSLPIPVESWSGIKDATTFGSNCPQTARFNLTEESLNEDCLFLNISAPIDAKKGEQLPVMLWIPGGAFVGGGSNMYKLDRLARLGRIIVVSINYRVGALGFMPHPAIDAHSNGTLGLEDQREAMRWVKKNIASFGGNPNNITIAGESAGSISICQHLANPDTVQELFHRALLISGTCILNLLTLKQALDHAVWKKISNYQSQTGTKIRCPLPGDAEYSDAKSLACLRSVPVRDLLEAQTYESARNPLNFFPITGNETVSNSFNDAIKSGNVLKVPMIMGGAKDELRLYVAYNVLGDNYSNTKYPITLDVVKNFYMPTYYGQDLEKIKVILKRYFGDENNPKNLNGATLGSMLSDFTDRVSTNHCKFLKTANALNIVPGMPGIFQFVFDDPHAPVLGVGISKSKDPGFELGAVHSSILNYLFPNYSNTAAIDAPDLSAASEKLGDQIITYFSSFMRHGAPKTEGLPDWIQYDGTPQHPSSNHVMLLAPDNIRSYNAYGGLDPSSSEGHQCAFWWSLYPD